MPDATPAMVRVFTASGCCFLDLPAFSTADRDAGLRWTPKSIYVYTDQGERPMAWQRQPPKSSSRRGQLAHGSFIHAVPRKALKAGEFAQISARDRWRTFQNSRPVIDSAA